VSETVTAGRVDPRRTAAALAPALAVVAVQLVAYPVSTGVWLQGLVSGLLNALVVLGMLLVYRANRVVNLAQASIGTFPSAIAIGLVLFGAPGLAASCGMGVVSSLVLGLAAATVLGWRPARVGVVAAVAFAGTVGGLWVADRLGYWGSFGAGLVTAAGVGLGIDALVVARFRRSPRLVLTVATIGLAQFFAVGALLVPRLWGKLQLASPDVRFGVPGHLSWHVGTTVLGGNELLAVAVSVVALAVVAVGLRRSDVGIAVRAAAERANRAAMVGVPVARVEAGVWVVASVLAFLGTFLQAGILGLEITAGVGLRVMVAALAALALAGFGSMPTAITSAIAIGVLAQASGPAGGNSVTTTDTVLAAVVLVGLLARRGSRARADRGDVSSWRASVEPRAVPRELAGLGVVRAARWVGGLVVVVVAAALPLVLTDSQTFRAATVAALGILALSVVVLTGWAGEVTLGQMAFAAAGAAVAAHATAAWRFDLTLALVVAGVAGAVVAVVVGLPSLRWQGVFLAVTTLAFAQAAAGYLLNPTEVSWIPSDAVYRRPLLGAWSLRGDAAMYEVVLVVLVVALVAVAGVRRSRTGRALRAVRDNAPGAQAYGVRLMSARLGAFAFSGFLAGVAGCLLMYVSEGYDVATYSADQGLNVFIAAVVGGVGSSVGALLGAGVLDGSRTFLSGEWALLPSAVGVLVVLLVLPGGLAELIYDVRDGLLRRLARRRGIEVPSLVTTSVPTPELGAAAAAPEPRAEVPHAWGGSARGSTDTGSADDDGEGQGRRAGVEGGVDGEGQGRRAGGGRGLLSVRGLDVAYDKVQVLFGVDLDVAEGRITALLGTNGAGKSTLLRAIGGVAPVTGGSLRLGDVDLAALEPHEVPRHGIAQMPGGQGVFPSLTVAENLRVAGWLLRHDHHELAQRTAEVVGRFPILERRLGDPAGDLSGGQQQQLALAMALLARPRVLLVDELSLGLAPVVVEQLLDQLRELRDAGTTIVIVEQSVNVALTVADHAYFLEKGEVRFSGDAADLLAQPDLVRAVYLQGARDALATVPPAPSQPVPPATISAAASSIAAGSTEAAAAAALAVEGLAVSFGGIAAVDHVSFSVAPGEVVGFIGPNGAGKTTVFDLVSGFTAADAGRVELFGRDLTGAPPSTRARAGLGRSFQDARLFGGVTVAETIAVALERWVQVGDPLSEAARLPAVVRTEAAVADRVDELIDLFGLGALREKRLRELSTGSRRMVDLACVVAHQPRVVLLDEPTSGIAQREAEALGPVLLGLRDRLGAALLVVEHDIALVSSISDRLVAMDQGAVVATGAPADVLDHPQVVASYLGSGGDALHRSHHAPGGAR
jgi:ABC-type branched-subunit amino acid transport system ATPase component/ABC-type branched-subunit amino acid transport system permease subunit